MPSDIQHKIFCRRKDFLLSNVQPTDDFWSHVQSKHVVSREGMAKIKSQPLSGRMEALLELVQGRVGMCWDVFLQVLVLSGHEHVADTLATDTVIEELRMKCGCQDNAMARGILGDVSKYYDRKHQLRSENYIEKIKGLGQKCDRIQAERKALCDRIDKHEVALEQLREVCRCAADKASMLPTHQEGISGFMEETDALEGIHMPSVQDDEVCEHLSKTRAHLKVLFDCLDRYIGNAIEDRPKSTSSAVQEMPALVAALTDIEKQLQNMATDFSKKELRRLQHNVHQLVPQLSRELDTKRQLEQQLMHLLYNVFQMDHLQRKEQHVEHTIRALQKELKLMQPKKKMMARQLADINQQICDEKTSLENVQMDLHRQITSAYHRRDRLIRLIPVQRELSTGDSGADIFRELTTSLPSTPFTDQESQTDVTWKDEPEAYPISSKKINITPNESTQQPKQSTVGLCTNEVSMPRDVRAKVNVANSDVADKNRPSSATKVTPGGTFRGGGASKVSKQSKPVTTVLSKQIALTLDEAVGKKKPVATVTGFPSKTSIRPKGAHAPNSSSYPGDSGYVELTRKHGSKQKPPSLSGRDPSKTDQPPRGAAARMHEHNGNNWASLTVTSSK